MKKIILWFILLSLIFLSGCKQEEHPEGSTGYTLYFVSNDSTKLVTKEYWTDSKEADELFAELLKELTKVPEKLEYMPPFGNYVSLQNWKMQGETLLLDFEGEYSKMTADTEVLTRAAIVKTFTQIKGISNVIFQVEGRDLEDAMGENVGKMYADSFIYNEGDQINNFEEITLNLYFANKDGDALVKTERTMMYNTNVAIEKVILEQLIAGPKAGGAYALINPDTKILSVVVKDGVCYVNLSTTFLTEVYSVTPEVVIYSIANSLCSVNGIDRVQISVDGDTGIEFRDKMQLNAAYEKNEQIIDGK